MSTDTNPKRMTSHRKKPRFIRQESWRYKRLETGWRKPRGKTSKMRRQQRGWPRLVRVGYGKPALLRGVHPSGYREVIVNRPSDLTMIDPKKQVARIAGTVGERKRLAIIDKAKELDIKVLNPVGVRKPEVEKEELAESEAKDSSSEEEEKTEATDASTEESSEDNQARVETA